MTERTPRALALRTARVVTLGLVLAGTTGCEAATDAYCDVFRGNAMCCSRTPGHTWNAATHTCDVTGPTPPPFVGPMVPPPS